MARKSFKLKCGALALCLSSCFLGANIAYAVDTGGFSNTTGGDIYQSVTVRTLGQLKKAVANGAHHIIVQGRIYGGPSLTTLTFQSTKNNNTTIEGAPGGQAVLENIQLKFDGELLRSGTNIENIKVSNITFYGRIADLQALPTQIYGTHNNAAINYLGVSLRRVSNAYVTHCTFYDISDDLMSVTLSSDYVTLSYNHYYFSDRWANMNPDPVWSWVGSYTDLAGERLAMVVGANSSDSFVGTGTLHVTLHHNWFGPNMRGRPLLRGWVHLYSNYFDNHPALSGYNRGQDGKYYQKQQYNALQVSSGGFVVSESNYFYYTNNTNSISHDSSGYASNFYERNNIYNHTTGTSAKGDNFGSAPVNYSYSITNAANVPSVVQNSAGPH